MRNKIITITVLVSMLIARMLSWNNISRYSPKEETKVEETKEKTIINENKEKEQNSKNNLSEVKTDEEIKTMDEPGENVENAPSSKKSEEVKQPNLTSKQEVKQAEQKEPVTIVEPKKQEIWEILGMTKDQYYNKPMYSWERVDFQTREDCEKHGDSYKPYIDGEVSYNCRDVTSPSGKYLGIMFDVEKLN